MTTITTLKSALDIPVLLISLRHEENEPNRLIADAGVYNNFNIAMQDDQFSEILRDMKPEHIYAYWDESHRDFPVNDLASEVEFIMDMIESSINPFSVLKEIGAVRLENEALGKKL